MPQNTPDNGDWQGERWPAGQKREMGDSPYDHRNGPGNSYGLTFDADM